MINEFAHTNNYLLVVDQQNDFCPGGQLAVAEGDTIIPAINVMAQVMRSANGMVIFTRDMHPKVTNHFGPDAWPEHCVQGTEGSEIHPDVVVDDKDIMLDKGMQQDEDGYSAFLARDTEDYRLDQYVLPAPGEETNLFVCGLAMDVCVKETVLDALALAREVNNDLRLRKMSVFLVADATKPVNLQPGDGEKALQQMKAAGALIVDSETVLQMIAA